MQHGVTDPMAGTEKAPQAMHGVPPCCTSDVSRIAMASDRLHLLQRKTKRTSVSLPWAVFEELIALADEQGRSTSNLIAFIVEAKLEEYKGDHKTKAAVASPFTTAAARAASPAAGGYAKAARR